MNCNFDPLVNRLLLPLFIISKSLGHGVPTRFSITITSSDPNPRIWVHRSGAVALYIYMYMHSQDAPLHFEESRLSNWRVLHFRYDRVLLKTIRYRNISDCDRSLVQSLGRKATVFLNSVTYEETLAKKRVRLTIPRHLRQKTIVFRLLENPDVRAPLRDDQQR